METTMNWSDNFAGGVTVCDANGIVIYMNDKSAKIFEKDGGKNLIGQSLVDCHPEPARTKLINLMETRGTNAYTIEKAGIKKLVYQSPWYLDNGEFGGLVELSLEIPMEMAHFVRTPKV